MSPAAPARLVLRQSLWTYGGQCARVCCFGKDFIIRPPDCLLPVYPYTLATSSSSLAWPLIPCLLVHGVPVYPYTLAASSSLAQQLPLISLFRFTRTCLRCSAGIFVSDFRGETAVVERRRQL